MGISLEVHGRIRTAQIARERRAAALLALTALLFIGSVGCGNQRVERKSAATQPASESKVAASTVAKRRDKGDAIVAARQDARPTRPTEPTGPTNRIRLTEKGCVQFEPTWTDIRIGQSLTWESDLKSLVIIHVSPGAFDRTEYVVRAGATVSTGPARGAGAFSIWTEPAACQGVPRGVRSSGPGVNVEGAPQNQ